MQITTITQCTTRFFAIVEKKSKDLTHRGTTIFLNPHRRGTQEKPPQPFPQFNQQHYQSIHQIQRDSTQNGKGHNGHAINATL